LFNERRLAGDAIGDRLRVLLRDCLRMAAPLRTEDRRVLEQIIFAHYQSDVHIKSVLFVGCDWYTAHYQGRYFAAHDYWTIDPDRTRRKFGAKQHVVARLEELGQHFPFDFFDLIVCNGVYGWGLDRAEDCDAAISECYVCLAENGHLLLGWNDLPQRDPAPLSNVRSLSRFSPYSFPAFGTWKYLTDTPHRHTYHFYQKRERRESTAPHSRR
jgi:SAM-dependent methyltransferase